MQDKCVDRSPAINNLVLPSWIPGRPQCPTFVLQVFGFSGMREAAMVLGSGFRVLGSHFIARWTCPESTCLLVIRPICLGAHPRAQAFEQFLTHVWKAFVVSAEDVKERARVVAYRLRHYNVGKREEDLG